MTCVIALCLVWKGCIFPVPQFFLPFLFVSERGYGVRVVAISVICHISLIVICTNL